MKCYYLLFLLIWSCLGRFSVQAMIPIKRTTLRNWQMLFQDPNFSFSTQITHHNTNNSKEKRTEENKRNKLQKKSPSKRRNLLRKKEKNSK